MSWFKQEYKNAIEGVFSKNIGKDIQKMPQSWSTALPRHQKNERWRTNNDKTNATHETTDKQIWTVDGG